MRWILSIFKRRTRRTVKKRRTRTIYAPRARIHSVQGRQYNLQQIYDLLNAHYFEGALDLQITWFGNQARSASSKRLLGSYNPRDRLIKIHRLLDSPHFPDYFISFIVYHEMLHHLFPPLKKKGRRQIHHPQFKEGERKFKHYEIAMNWQKENKDKFFTLR